MKKGEILAREELYRGFYRLERVRLRHDRFAGGSTPVLARELAGRGDIAAALPYDPDSDRFVMIEQFRPGPLAAGHDPWLLEIVAGYVEEGEAPEVAARREIVEETGCPALAVAPLATYFLAPNFSPDRVHLFLARVEAPDGSRLCGRDDEDEDIRVVPMKRREVWRRAAAGGIVTPWALLAVALARATPRLLRGLAR